MIRSLLIMAFMSITLIMNAQSDPVLTDFVYLPNMPITLHKQVGLYYLPLQSGEDAYWDFSNLVGGSTLSREFEVSEGGDGVEATLESNGEYFLIEGDSVIKRVGEYYPGDWQIMPLSYTIMDASNLGWTDGGSTFDGMLGTCYENEITFTSSYMGYGTLALPSGTYENVLRVEVVKNHVSDCANGWPGTGYSTSVYNYFFSSGCHYELLRLETNDYEFIDIYGNVLTDTYTSKAYFPTDESLSFICDVADCNDESACNYNPSATSDLECYYEGDPCDDGIPETIGDTYSSCECIGNLPGDIDGDGIVGISDLTLFLSDYECVGECVGDFNGDSVVNSADLVLLLSLL